MFWWSSSGHHRSEEWLSTLYSQTQQPAWFHEGALIVILALEIWHWVDTSHYWLQHYNTLQSQSGKIELIYHIPSIFQYYIWIVSRSFLYLSFKGRVPVKISVPTVDWPHLCISPEPYLSVFLYARLSLLYWLAGWLLRSLKYWFLISEMNGKQNSRWPFLVRNHSRQAIYINFSKLVLTL